MGELFFSGEQGGIGIFSSGELYGRGDFTSSSGSAGASSFVGRKGCTEVVDSVVASGRISR